ncbi:GGDEF domain-containing protein [Desulfovibrio desulfuricans]|uniref:GGDEF domain-containing protein n=1 Tax=Desulfovibrio desulfuricans TaxID=876 RepID=UPI0017823A42|nr:GGDEF domain-containing protein [Desulfovibrio desulfuricans]MBD8897190.1 GGDEF domain-containing protein [Desulfovibrio desulfuricans]UIB00225.1 GGDEF domain-containing protein [Desulfovibrio desulfuricans]
MIDLLSNFDAFTMAVLVAALYFSLSSVLVYTYLYRRTYPGFGSMTLGLVCWSVGLFLNYFRPFDLLLSLYIGGVLMLLSGVFLFRGLLLYGGVRPRRRMAVNYGVFAVISAAIAYYMFVDFDTCTRVAVFSLGMAFMFLRIGFEPYVVKGWKRYATQSLLSAMFVVLGAVFVLRAYKAFNAVQCLPSGPDDMAKALLLMAMFIASILTFSIITMTFARMEAELRVANEELQDMSETDALTSLANRRKFDAAYESEWKRAVRGRLGMAIVILDVDDFKNFNDQYGHQEGDECLRKLAQVLQAHARRTTDVAARYGGEEFALILPGMGATEAFALAEDVRQAFAKIGIEHATGRHGNVVTVSAGVAVLEPAGKKNRRELLRAADAALYAAKAKGKNIVMHSAGAEGATGRV